MEELALKSGVKAKGVHIITLCKATSDGARKLQDLIVDVEQRRSFAMKMANNAKYLHDLWEEYRYYLELLHKRFKTFEIAVENITTTEGRNVFARLLSGDNTYSGNISHCALGDDNTAPAIGDTQLVNEVYRKALSSGTYANNIAYLETFFTATEDTGTYEEYGFFIDGTGSANSGQIFNRFTTQTVKSNTETMNVQSQVTISDA